MSPAATPPADVPGGLTIARVVGVAAFVLLLVWLSIVLGIGALDVVSRSWCGDDAACAGVFWPRLTIAAVGGMCGFLLAGYGLLSYWRTRGLAVFAILGVAVAVGTGIGFIPILRG